VENRFKWKQFLVSEGLGKILQQLGVTPGEGNVQEGSRAFKCERGGWSARAHEIDEP